MAKKQVNKKNEKKDEVLLIKPASRMLGLDYLHITLLVLVVILIALAFGLSFFKPGATLTNCQYGLTNGTCTTPKYNATQALLSAENYIASYQNVNSSYDLLSFLSIPQQATVSYLQNTNQWLVVMPFRVPLPNGTISSIIGYTPLFLSGANLTVAQAYHQAAAIPPYLIKDHTIAFGVVQLHGRVPCAYKTPIPVYMVTDPYAPGSIAGIQGAINASQKYGNEVNMSYKFMVSGYALSLYGSYGVNETEGTIASLYCASQQPRFPAYFKNYSIVYNNRPISNSVLTQVAVGSGLNLSDYNSCLANSTIALAYQAQFGRFYNLTTGAPTDIVNCQYQTIPETLPAAIDYALNQTSVNTPSQTK